MPFMAIALLYGCTGHNPAYDLKSLFNVLLAISTHLMVFGDHDKNHGLVLDRATRVAEWFKVNSFHTLADLKAGQFILIESLIFNDITKPFKILQPHLTTLFQILFPPHSPDIRTLERWQSPATCQEFIKALDGALLDQAIVGDARQRHSSTASAFHADPINRKKRAATTSISTNEQRPMTCSRSSGVQSSGGGVK
jgi:hypothetical protein